MDEEQLQKLKTELEAILSRGDNDPEQDHVHADDALLSYINDPDVTRLFNSIKKWYA